MKQVSAKPRVALITCEQLPDLYIDDHLLVSALEDIGINEEKANEIGVRLYKVGCPWPLDIEHIKDFARGLELLQGFVTLLAMRGPDRERTVPNQRARAPDR